MESGKWKVFSDSPEVSANFIACTAAPQAPFLFMEKEMGERKPVGKPRFPDALPHVGFPRQSNEMLQTCGAKILRLIHTRLSRFCIPSSLVCIAET